MIDSGARSAAPTRSLDGLHLDLDVFDGPFDLLVTLILRDEVDLWEIRVSRIVAEYILRLAESEEFDLEATSHFIVLVAALLEMKSRRLLDAGSPFLDELAELDEQAAGEELLDTLLRFARFKGAAGRLGCAVRPSTPAGCTARRRCPSGFCGRRAPGRLCRPLRSPAPSACCSPSRRLPTSATSPTSPSPWWPNCAGCATCWPPRRASHSRRWRRAAASRKR